MNYKDYIDLGFERIDTYDKVQFERTGNESFILVKKLNKKASIEVWCDELNKPKLYIDKKNGELPSYSLDLRIYQLKELLGLGNKSDISMSQSTSDTWTTTF